LTQAWLGRFAVSGSLLIASVVLFIAFSRTSKTYLNFLALRAEDNDVIVPPAAQVDPQIK
ncbi:MAG: hypothetical protein ABIV39_09740, partial [Verrucomicrobiota bacterium]